MGVLVTMPVWAAPSELWLQRQLEMLQPELARLATPPPNEPHWRGQVPVTTLADGPVPAWRRAARKFWAPVPATPRPQAWQVMLRAVESPEISRVLAHYVTSALDYRRVWERTRKPLFVLGHGFDIMVGERLPHRDQPRFGDAYWRSVVELSQRAPIIVGTRFAASKLLGIGVPPDRLIIKNYSAPVPAAPPLRPPRTRGLTVLYLGRLADYKGPDLVLRAFEIACDRGLDARLVVAGDGDLRGTCRLLAHWSRHRDRIELLGAVAWERVPELMAQADIFAAHSCIGPLTHGAETFGVAFVEAMGMGLPVVTGRAASLPEIITSGHDGFLVEPGDVEAQAGLFLELAANPELRQTIGVAARQTVRERFAPSRERRQLRQILGLPITE